MLNLAARHLPTIYPFRYYVAGGGLAYGPDQIEQMQSAAGHIDRILKGEKPADVPCKHRQVLSAHHLKTRSDDPSRAACARGEVME
jgi:hypothetical protein